MGNAREISEALREAQVENIAGVACELRELVPAPVAVDMPELERAVAGYRVLLIRRGAVVAVSTLISVGGALMFHALLAGVIVIGVWFPGLMWTDKGAQTLAGPVDMGGSAGGFTMLGIGPDDNAPPAALAPEVLGVPVKGDENRVLPRLPELPVEVALPTSSPMLPESSLVPSPTDLGSARVFPPGIKNTPELVAAPGTSSTVTKGGPTGMPTRGTGEGDGGGEEDRIFGLIKGDGSGGSGGGGGSGKGIGSGRGNGIDRGLSAADRPAQLLNQNSGAAELAIPAQYQLKVMGRDVGLVISLAADGTITAVRVAQSCGVPEVDELVRAHVQTTYRFSPEYRKGKAVASEQEWGYAFHPL